MSKTESTAPVDSIPIDGELPFPRPVGLSDAELAALLRFLRSASTQRVGPRELGHEPYDRKLPILSIERLSNRIEVTTGFRHSPISGSGQRLTIRIKDDNHFVLLSVLRWEDDLFSATMAEVSIPSTPVEGDLPFPRPDGFSDAELIALVDYLRTTRTRRTWPRLLGWIPSGPVYDRKLAILAIKRVDNQIGIMTGFCYGPRFGAGQFLTVDIDDDGRFNLTHVTSWMS